MNSRIVLVAIVGAVLCGAYAHAAPNPTREAAGKPSDKAVGVGDSFELSNEIRFTGDNTDPVFSYEPVEPRKVDYKTSTRDETADKLKPTSLLAPGGESAKRPNLMVAASQADEVERSGSPNVDKIKDIAMNSREVRLVGPSQREVEMKDDLPTKVVVALENLQKETQEVLSTINDKLDKSWTTVKQSEVWGQMNERLDKGWTDFKGMVDGLVSPANKSG